MAKADGFRETLRPKAESRPSAPFKDNPDSFIDAISDANALYGLGEDALAVAKYGSALKADGALEVASGLPRLGRAHAYENLGRAAEARNDFDWIARPSHAGHFQPGDVAEALIGRGRMNGILGDGKAALSDYVSASQLIDRYQATPRLADLDYVQPETDVEATSRFAEAVRLARRSTARRVASVRAPSPSIATCAKRRRMHLFKRITCVSMNESLPVDRRTTTFKLTKRVT